MDISITRLRVIGKKAVPFWWRFAYLIPSVFDKHPDIADRFTKVIQGKDSAFVQYVQSNVQAYIEKGTLPPESIVAPIINLAEDIMAGREPVLRAGDYIAIQNQMRA